MSYVIVRSPGASQSTEPDEDEKSKLDVWSPLGERDRLRSNLTGLRRIDWPAATAADPGKNTWDSDRHRRPHVFRFGAPLVSVVAKCFDMACDSKCEELFATVSDRHRRRHVFRHHV